ncbi:hypothetical protein FCR2A7T_05580 [Flavobacterium cauense R2A-7]|uniref:hypothetical protein n=1 Tax=Flavobacterium cauense TaxID=510946 RepID=UPI0003C63BAE|nr:hypothetical protein [Flavobacterium cauense]ESU21385.1 hypothetical protein FCR2A7T_05580 [Flavobacterium cauense R2A-7]KGO79193.1 hypothetical protein Q762_14580 [Flavobacterium cauense R2A-7]
MNTNRIETYFELENLLEVDNSTHKLRDVTELFLTAMNDWPTYNQIRIEEFITELKEFFGTPLSIEKIESKKLNLDDENVWRNESGSSICEMIKISKLFYGEANFDNIINSIFNYYGNLKNNASS